MKRALLVMSLPFFSACGGGIGDLFLNPQSLGCAHHMPTPPAHMQFDTDELVPQLSAAECAGATPEEMAKIRLWEENERQRQEAVRENKMKFYEELRNSEATMRERIKFLRERGDHHTLSIWELGRIVVDTPADQWPPPPPPAPAERP